MTELFIFSSRPKAKSLLFLPFETEKMTSLGPAGSTVLVPYGFFVDAAKLEGLPSKNRDVATSTVITFFNFLSFYIADFSYWDYEASKIA